VRGKRMLLLKKKVTPNLEILSNMDELPMRKKSGPAIMVFVV
jgi:hypothetical protein